MIEIFNLFPQNVGKFSYTGDLSLYIKELYNIKDTKPNEIKNVPPEICYQTNMSLFDNYNIFLPLKSFLKLNIEKYFQTSIQIPHSWGNIYTPYGFSQAHTHHDHDIAGVIYLQSPQNDKLYITEKTTLSLSKIFYPKDGDVFIFSGDQPHMTFPCLSNQDKIIIAFNINFIK